MNDYVEEKYILYILEQVLDEYKVYIQALMLFFDEALVVEWV